MAKGKKTGGGSRLGKPNKVTATVREAFEKAFTLLQDDDQANLGSWARSNPTEFYKLAAKLIPTDVNLQGTVQYVVKSEFPDAPANHD